MLPVIAVAFACVSGAVSVGFGAFGAHALRDSLSPRLLETFQTAVAYQMSHSLALLLAVILIGQWGRNLALDLAVYAFMAGIVLFCGSLYLLVLTEVKWPGPITPLGGVFLMVAWLSLAVGSTSKLIGS